MSKIFELQKQQNYCKNIIYWNKFNILFENTVLYKKIKCNVIQNSDQRSEEKKRDLISSLPLYERSREGINKRRERESQKYLYIYLSILLKLKYTLEPTSTLVCNITKIVTDN